MSDHHIRNVIEASLLAAGKPLSINEIAELFDEDGRPDKGQLQSTLESLASEYEDRGIELRETASGWRIQIRQGYAREVSRLWPERPQKYSRALLETLALIAYRQPITRAEIESVRGVAVNPNIVKTLMEREWIRVVGHRDVPGHPELLGTTRSFLDYFGLRTIDELPPLAEIKQMVDLNPQLTLPVADTTDPDAVVVAVEAGEGDGQT
ncbi:MAG: SMC-Scp complex subunit ScpB [Gammaproteobacteria bacterium]